MIPQKEDEKKEKEARAEKRAENQPIKDSIVATLGEEKMTASVIGEKTGHSTQKITALCRQMVEEGVLTVEDIKITGKGTRKAYSVV